MDRILRDTDPKAQQSKSTAVEIDSEDEDLDLDNTQGREFRQDNVTLYDAYLDWIPDEEKPNHIRLKDENTSIEEVHFANATELRDKVTAKPKLWSLVLRRSADELTRLTAIEKRVNPVMIENKKLREQYVAVKRHNTELEDEINALHSQNDVDAVQAELDKVNVDLSESKASAQRRGRRADASAAQVQEHEQTINALRTETSKYGRRAKEAQESLVTTTNENIRLKKKIELLEAARPLRDRSVSFVDGRSPSRSRSRSPRPRSPSSPHRSVATSTSTTRARYIKIPDPAVFKGDKKLYMKWRGDMKVKIGRDYQGDPVGAIEYISNRTQDRPYDRLEARFPFNGSKNAFKDPNECFDILDKHFKEKDEAARSRAEYKTLQQAPGEAFDEFHSKWETLVYKLDMAESQMASELLDKLNEKYYNAVYQEDYSLDELVERCHTLSYKFAEKAARVASNPSSNSNASKTQRSGNTSSNKPGNKSSEPRARNKIPFPEDFRGLPPLTDALKAKLREEGKCHSCRQVGHKSFEMVCPIKQWREANKLALSNSTLSISQINTMVAQQVGQAQLEAAPTQGLLTNGDQGNE